MGRKDRALIGYLNRTAVFEELYNVGIYGGEPVISAQDLVDVQNAYQETFKNRYGRNRKTIRIRDAAKALRINGHFVILAVECQAEINYGMPLRCMEYDVEDFIRQLRRIRHRHEQDGDLKSKAEFLSGIKETDRLNPVITVLLYHGPGKWNAAASLQDMVDMEGLDEKMRTLLPDYKLHVIHLTELDETLFQTGLRELVGMMKRSGEKKRMLQFMKENEERFRNMDDELYDLICTMMGLKKIAGKKEACRNEGKETYDMCVAFDEMMRDSKMQGEKKGEARLSSLISRLYQEDRAADVLKAAQSVRFRNKLYREYGI